MVSRTRGCRHGGEEPPAAITHEVGFETARVIGPQLTVDGVELVDVVGLDKADRQLLGKRRGAKKCRREKCDEDPHQTAHGVNFPNGRKAS